MVVNTKYSIGDKFIVKDRWSAICTAIEISGNKNVISAVYKLEWISDGCFKHEWFTEDRLVLLGIGKEGTLMARGKLTLMTREEVEGMR
jgi:hypothetical protein